MSGREIDERVVEMRFDNQNFEKNVRSTMSTLDKFKEKLNFKGATKGLEEVSKAANKCDISSLGNAVQTIQVKFSALEAVALTTLSRITNSAITTGENLIKSLSIDNISAGWDKFGQKTTSVGTLISQGYDIETVSEQLERLNWFTDETSYNFTSMVSNIAKFTAAGKNLKESVTAMEGIANWAALSGQNATTASSAMYQISQAMGAGIMRREDYKSIQNVSMDTAEFRQKALDAAVALGTLRKNADGTYHSLMATGKSITDFSINQFADHLTQDAWFTSDVMMKVFNEYSSAVDQIYAYSEEKGITASEAISELGDNVDAFGLKAFKAAQEARTWSDVIDSVKDAVSTGWMNTFELIVGNYEQATTVWTELANTLYDVFAEGGNARNELLKAALSGENGWEGLTKKVSDCGVKVEDFQNALIATGKKHKVVTDQAIEEAGGFEESLKSGWVTSRIVSEALEELAGGMSIASDATADATSKLEELRTIADRVIQGEFGNGVERIEALTAAGYDASIVQDLVNNKLLGTEVDLTKLSDTQLKSLGYTEDQVKALKELAKQAEKTGTPISELIKSIGKPTGRELIIDSFRNALSGLIEVIDTVKASWRDIFPAMTADRLYELVTELHDFSERLNMTDETAEKLRKTLAGVFAVLDVIRTVVGGGLKFALTLIKGVIDSLGLSIFDVSANVGDALVSFRDWVKEHNIFVKAAEKVVPIIVKIIDVIKAWIGRIKEIPAFANIFSSFSDGAKSIYEGVRNFISGALDRLNKFLDTLKNVDSFNLERIGDQFVGMKNKVVGCFTGANSISDAISNFWNLLFGSKEKNIGKNITDTLKPATTAITNVRSSIETFSSTAQIKMEDTVSVFESVSERIKGVFTSIRDWFAGLDWGAIFGVGISVGVIAALMDIAKVLKVLVAPIKAVTGVLNGLVKIEKAIAFEKKANAINTIGTAILKMAGAIAILALSIKILSDIGWEKMWPALAAISGLAILFTGLAIVMTKVTKEKEVASFSMALLSFAGSVLILTAALKILEGVRFTDVWQGLLIIAGIMAALIGIAAILSRMNAVETAMKGLAIVMLSFSLSVGILVNSLKKLQEFDADQLGSALNKLIQVMVVLGGVALAGSKASWGTAATLIAAALALKMIVGTIKELAGMDASTCLIGLQRVQTIFEMFALVLLSTRRAGRNAGKAGAAILAMSASLLLVGLSMKLLATIKPSDLIRTQATIVSIFDTFALVVTSSFLAGKNASKAGTMILSMSVAMLILAGAMGVMTMLDPNGLDRALSAVTQLMLIFGVLVGVSHFAGSSIGTIIALSIAVALLSGAIAALTLLDSDKLKDATIALGSVMAVMAILVASTHFSSDSVGYILALSVAVAAIGVVLSILAQQNPSAALASAESLSIVLLALSASLFIISKSDSISAGAVASIAGMLLALAGISVIFKMLDEWDLAPTLETAAALSTVLLALCGAVAVLGFAGKGSLAGVGEGVLALDLIVIDIIALIGSIGAIANVLDEQLGGAFTASIDAGIALLVKVAEGLGQVISGFGVGLTSGLPEMGENIGAFWQNVQPMMDGLSQVDKQAVTGAGVLAQTLLSITAGEILDAIASFISGGENNLATFAENIGSLGEGLADFSESLGEDFKSKSVVEGAKAIQILGQASKSIGNASPFAWLTGSTDYEGFKKGLPLLGEGLTGFACSLGENFDADTVKTASEALSTLAKVSSGLENEGGLFNWLGDQLFGESDASGFGESLKALGSGLKGFSNSADGIDTDTCSTAISILQNLIDLTKNIPNSGGWLGAIVGENDADDFGKQLSGLGSGLAHFSDAVSGDAVDSEAVENACDSLSLLIEVAKSIPNSGGWLGAIVGENDADNFGAKLGGLGAGLVTFSGTVSGSVDYDAVKQACDSLTLIVGVSKEIPNSGGWLGAIVGENDADTFGNRLSSLATGIVAFSSTVASGVNVENVEVGCTCLKKIINTVSSIPNIDEKFKMDDFTLFGEMLASIGDGLETFAYISINLEDINSGVKSFDTVMASLSILDFSNLTTLSEAVSDLDFSGVQSFLDCFKSITTTNEAEVAGGFFMDAIATGMRNEYDGIKSELGNFIGTGSSSLVGKAKSYYDSFYDAGRYLVEGFSNGIDQNMYLASAKSRAMAKAAKVAAQEELDENSPSKEGYQIGDFFGIGFVNGIKDNVDTAYGTSRNMAESARKGLTNTLSRIADVINSGIDPNPVIRPVVDLSDVTSSSSRIGGIFGLRPSLALSSTGAINFGMSQRHNTGNADVISALKELGGKLGKSSGDTYNINGVKYDDGSAVSEAVKVLVRAARVERRR